MSHRPTQISSTAADRSALTSGESGRSAEREARLGRLRESAKQAFAAAGPGLVSVEERIRISISQDDSPFADVSCYLLELGGKRIRPLLALLSARTFGMLTPSRELIDVSAGIELVHMATLLHDDIIDQSPLRRSKPSVYASFGLGATLLAGDFLLARAFGLCSGLDPFIIRETEQACVALSEGELIEGRLTEKRAMDLTAYLEVVNRKTAALFALAALSGAHFAGAAHDDIDRMRAFGRVSGVAFQIADDILDVTADETVLGKPPGTDLRQQTPSLVNIAWLNSGAPEARRFFALETPSQEECICAIEFLKRSSVLDECRSIAQDFANQARNIISELQHQNACSSDAELILAVVDYIVERDL